MIDVFNKELIITSLNRTRTVVIDKFTGLLNNGSYNQLYLGAHHVKDVVIVHPRKLPTKGIYT